MPSEEINPIWATKSRTY